MIMEFKWENYLGYIKLSVQLKKKKAGVHSILAHSTGRKKAWIKYFVLTDKRQDHQKAVSAKLIIPSAKSLFQKKLKAIKTKEIN